MSLQRHDEDRGAVIVEFALVASLIVTILFGLVEFGFAWETRLATQSATRSGARVGSSLGENPMADFSILESLESSLTAVGVGNVDYIVIYRANSAGGRPTPACAGGTASNECNVYPGSALSTLPSPPAPLPCDTGTRWCPSERQVIQAAGPDYLGVYVKLEHNFITGFFGEKMTLTDHSVMRLEPGG